MSFTGLLEIGREERRPRLCRRGALTQCRIGHTLALERHRGRRAVEFAVFGR